VGQWVIRPLVKSTTYLDVMPPCVDGCLVREHNHAEAVNFRIVEWMGIAPRFGFIEILHLDTQKTFNFISKPIHKREQKATNKYSYPKQGCHYQNTFLHLIIHSLFSFKP
jgi:hypothetical protein